MVTGNVVEAEKNSEWDDIEALRIHNNVELILPKGRQFAKIENIEPVPALTQTDSDWAIASGAKLDLGSALGTVNDFLEPAAGQLYVLKWGMYSDVNIEAIIRPLGTTGELFGIKNAATVRLNQTMAPFRNPRIVLKSLKGVAVPSILLENNDRDNAHLVKFKFQGKKFTLSELSDQPLSPAHPITLTHIGESYR